MTQVQPSLMPACWHHGTDTATGEACGVPRPTEYWEASQTHRYGLQACRLAGDSAPCRHWGGPQFLSSVPWSPCLFCAADARAGFEIRLKFEFEIVTFDSQFEDELTLITQDKGGVPASFTRVLVYVQGGIACSGRTTLDT